MISPQNHGEDQVIESKPPQYDFEKLIEKALKEAGEEIPTQSELSEARTTNRPVGTKKKEISEKERKKKEEAAALLEKRKKYDPRKALKKAPKGAKQKREKKATELEDGSTLNQLNKGYDEIKVTETEEITQSNLPNEDATLALGTLGGQSEMTAAPDASIQKTVDD